VGGLCVEPSKPRCEKVFQLNSPPGPVTPQPSLAVLGAGKLAGPILGAAERGPAARLDERTEAGAPGGDSPRVERDRWECPKRVESDL